MAPEGSRISIAASLHPAGKPPGPSEATTGCEKQNRQLGK